MGSAAGQDQRGGPTEMRIVVVGGGQAGSAAVARLRALGHAGALTLIGEEPVPPYQRPPLSKAYLIGEMEEERLYLRPAAFYADQGIDLLTGVRVTGIDRMGQTVDLGDRSLGYEALILATGAVPRRLPAAVGGDLAGVHVLRDLADVDAMRPSFVPGARLLVVGGGYIGLEAAAVARKLGVAVTLIEMAPRILQRVAAPQTSDYIRALHQGHGVEVLEGIGLTRLTGEDGRVTGAVLSDGREVPCDFVIVGVGVVPDTALAAQAGLAVENGIATDELGRTSDPRIWAAGDCASFLWRGGRARLESVQNAIDMAEAVAANVLGAGMAYDPKPWFWSDQYDCKLQIAGLNTGYQDVVTRRAGDGTSFWYYAGDRLLAVDAMNDPRAYMVGKRLIELGRSPDRAVIADPATELKALLKA